MWLINSDPRTSIVVYLKARSLTTKCRKVRCGFRRVQPELLNTRNSKEEVMEVTGGNESILSEVAAGDLVFVDMPPSDLDVECPVCLGILADPHLNTCCGHHFCDKCLDRIRHRPCPLCKGRFTSIRNLSAQHAILSMEVYCLHRLKGCQWQGELRLLHEHMYSLDGCPYSKCPLNCGEVCLRSELGAHTRSQCPKRFVDCLYCFQAFSWYELIEHEGACPKAPRRSK